MPEISRFLGIVIRMYFLDHEPPHCHAAYAGAEAWGSKTLLIPARNSRSPPMSTPQSLRPVVAGFEGSLSGRI